METNTIFVLIVPLFLMVVLLFLRVPIGVALGFAGFIGFCMVSGFGPAMNKIGRISFWQVLNYTYSPVVLFVFLGEVMVFTGIGGELFDSASKWMGRMPGSLAISTVIASCLFGAICGLSVAGALTIGGLAIPEMRKRGYSGRFATGTVAAGGTLSIMIPPSVPMVIYGLIAEESIGKLFIAGIIPGVIITILFSIYCYVHGIRHPECRETVKVAWRDKLITLKVILPVGLLFIIILGGIYLGLDTPSEAGGIGAAGALIIAATRKSLSFRNLIEASKTTVETVGMILIIFIGAIFFGQYMAMTGYTDQLVKMLTALPVPPFVILLLLFLVIGVMGCFIDVGSIVLITTPLFLPVIKTLGYSPIWYGVILIIGCEMAALTPPVGLNLFVIKGLVPDVPMIEVIKGSLPYVWILTLAMFIFLAFPSIVTWLPTVMMPLG